MPPKIAVSQAPSKRWAVLASFGPPKTAVERITSSSVAPGAIVRPLHRATIATPARISSAGQR